MTIPQAVREMRKPRPAKRAKSTVVLDEMPDGDEEKIGTAELLKLSRKSTRDLLGRVDELESAIKRYNESQPGRHLEFLSIREALESTRSTLRHATLEQSCKRCAGNGCDHCLWIGCVSESSRAKQAAQNRAASA